ncbi:MAG: ABC transporter permease [Candidatus Aminicenantes bacterium]|nr:ABC transporter permease [Candidatus Aminicenantes bacterium]
MLWNYLKITVRIIQRHKGYAFINMAGLTLGMTIAALIMLWVVDELGFDRYHEHSSQIHRVYVDFQAGSHMTLALSMPELAKALIDEFPEIEGAARISRPERIPIRYKDKEFFENYVCYGDGSLFEVFSFAYVSGNPKSALQAPYSAVITESMAEKYFGDEDPIGKILRIAGDKDYAVNGVVADVPSNSHFRFHVVRSFETLYSERRQDMENWLNIQYYTYLLLSKKADVSILEQKLPSVVDKHLGQVLASTGGKLNLFLQPLTRIHLFSKIGGEIAAQGDITYVCLFSGIAFFVLILACINFINLATARSSTRVREIGIRKTLGSSRQPLICQFLGESMIYSIGSFLVAAVVIQTIRPWFESLIGRRLVVSMLHTPWLLIGFIGLAAAIGILAGSYPAFYLSAFQPIHVFKGVLSSGTYRSLLRSGLVVFQFAVSIILIIGTITVYQQIRFMKNKNLGFNKEHILVIPEGQSLLHLMSFTSLRSEWMNVPGVINVAGSALVPTTGVQNDIFYPEGFTREQPQKLTRLDIEPHYIPTMDIKIVSGRNFSPKLSTDPSASLLINETVAKHFGWTDPLGKTFIYYPAPGGEGETVTKQVVGVVKDFHFTSLHRRIEPLVLAYNPDRIRYISVRISPKNIQQTLSLLKKKWENINPQRPFDFFFLEAAFDSQYRTEDRVGNLSLYFSLLAIFIGCLGLFGLASYMAERRTKEIGIRKVLGASVPGIVRLLSREFLWLVLIANVIAWPAAYGGLTLWLRNFPYRIDVNLIVMAAAGLIALLTALFTVSIQAVKAALANPVDALRYE